MKMSRKMNENKLKNKFENEFENKLKIKIIAMSGAATQSAVKSVHVYNLTY